MGERAAGAGPGAAHRGVLALVCTAQFMVVLDVSVVNVALPPIREALDFTPGGVQWVAGAYALAFAGFLLPGGRLADLYGRSQAFTAGLALFTAASLVGGLATAPWVLVAARAAQGLGAAVLAPATLTVLTSAFPEGPARVRALAVWTAVGLAGGASGNLVGGLLTEALSWRAVLLVNVPLGLLAVGTALRVLTGGHRRAAVRGGLDVPGALAAAVGLTALTYGLTRAADHGRADPGAVACLAAGVLALAVLAVVETRTAAAPLLPPRLLRERATGLGNLLMLLSGACLQIPMWYFLAFAMHDVLGFGALATGLGFLPHTLVTMLVGWRVAPRLMERFRARTLVAAGALTAAAGFAWQAAALSSGTYLTAVAGPAVAIALGAGLFATPLTAVVTSGARAEDAGAVSGLMNTAKQAGGAVGLALLVPLASAGSAGGGPAAGYSAVFWALAAVQAATALLALLLPARPGPGPAGPGAVRGGAAPGADAVGDDQDLG
ncbi:MFS transporter [Nocardiopsis sp. NPDC006139]|uniref:MFS transporter n=1 Tax=Nocardiopsis sp. NPDC006139 TaxID=3154578 RepID=UPI0033ABCC9E